MMNNLNINFFAICINNSDYPTSLELHRVYPVLSDDDAALDGDIRIIDESGEDYLYSCDNFLLIEIPYDRKQILLNSFVHARVASKRQII